MNWHHQHNHQKDYTTLGSIIFIHNGLNMHLSVQLKLSYISGKCLHSGNAKNDLIMLPELSGIERGSRNREGEMCVSGRKKTENENQRRKLKGKA